jgi:hypothetical protein
MNKFILNNCTKSECLECSAVATQVTKLSLQIPLTSISLRVFNFALCKYIDTATLILPCCQHNMYYSHDIDIAQMVEKIYTFMAKLPYTKFQRSKCSVLR